MYTYIHGFLCKLGLPDSRFRGGHVSGRRGAADVHRKAAVAGPGQKLLYMGIPVKELNI